MNYVDIFYAVLNGSYQTTGRKIGPLKCKKVSHSIEQPRTDVYGRRAESTFKLFHIIEINRRVNNELVALGDMSGKIYLKYSTARHILGNATSLTMIYWDRILHQDYSEQGTVEYRGETWYCYQYKKSPIVEIYGLRVTQAITFKNYLLTKYGERT
jgi:hypothetical protein